MTSRTPPPAPPATRRVSAKRDGGWPYAQRSAQEPSGVELRPRDYEHYVQLDAQGQLLFGHGQTEQLAAVTAYASNVADVVGRMLQFGSSRAVEAKFQHSLLFVLRNEAGQVVGLRARSAQHLPHLRALLKL